MAKDKTQEALYKAEGIRRAALRKEKRKNSRKVGFYCQHCHAKSSHYMEKVINPYYQEMNGIVIWERMCNDCYQSACGDL